MNVEVEYGNIFPEEIDRTLFKLLIIEINLKDFLFVFLKRKNPVKTLIEEGRCS